MKHKEEQKRLAGIQDIESYKLALYPLIIGVTVLMSILSVNFDWEVIRSATFWFMVTLKILILFAWVYFGVPDGKKLGQKKPLFVDKKKDLQQSATLIKDKGLLLPFRQYVNKWNKDTKTEYGDKLLFANNIDPELKKKTDKDLKAHYEEYDLDSKQLKVLLEVKKGRYYFKQTNAETYLSEFEVVNSQEQAKVNEAKIIFKVLTPKVVLLFIMTFLTTAAIITEKSSAQEAWFEAISNLFLCVSSYGFAIKTGLVIMERYTRAYEVRNNYIHEFIEQFEKGKFVPTLSKYEEYSEEAPVIEDKKPEADIPLENSHSLSKQV